MNDRIGKLREQSLKADIKNSFDSIDYYNDSRAYEKREQLQAMEIVADSLIFYAERHSKKLLELSQTVKDKRRKKELEEMAAICRRVPAYAPATFHEALQYYWFVHLGVITELNPWDSFNPGRLDQHLYPFYRSGLENQTLNEEKARELLQILADDFKGHEEIRNEFLNHTPKYGNDDDYADSNAVKIFNFFYDAVNGRPTTKGGSLRINLLPTTCHVYFGSVVGAMPDGRKAGRSLSEGISPVQGADRKGPTAVIKSAAKIDHIKTGGTLLNQKFTPSFFENEESLRKLAYLIRSYFRLDGHHIQFNVVDAEMLQKAQKHPENYRDLIVRVAGYSDYFCDLGEELQNEIIARTEQVSV